MGDTRTMNAAPRLPVSPHCRTCDTIATCPQYQRAFDPWGPADWRLSVDHDRRRLILTCRDRVAGADHQRLTNQLIDAGLWTYGTLVDVSTAVCVDLAMRDIDDGIRFLTEMNTVLQ